jgi:glycyl-tRNA synthetase beta chain
MDKRDLLFELGTEELPPRAAARLCRRRLTENLVKGLDAAGIPTARCAASRRRGACRRRRALRECRRRTAQVERRGPPLANSFDAQWRTDPGGARVRQELRRRGRRALERLTTDKGRGSLSRHRAGAATTASLGGIVTGDRGAADRQAHALGRASAEFVRPVHWIVLLLGEEVVACEVLGLTTGRVTYGHRFHAPGPISS